MRRCGRGFTQPRDRCPAFNLAHRTGDDRLRLAVQLETEAGVDPVELEEPSAERAPPTRARVNSGKYCPPRTITSALDGSSTMSVVDVIAGPHHQAIERLERRDVDTVAPLVGTPGFQRMGIAGVAVPDGRAGARARLRHDAVYLFKTHAAQRCRLELPDGFRMTRREWLPRQRCRVCAPLVACARGAPGPSDITTLRLDGLAHKIAAWRNFALRSDKCLSGTHRQPRRRIHAYVTVTSDQARRARRAAERHQSAGERGALFGVPIAHKDLFETAGIRTTAGSKLFERAHAGQGRDAGRAAHLPPGPSRSGRPTPTSSAEGSRRSTRSSGQRGTPAIWTASPAARAAGRRPRSRRGSRWPPLARIPAAASGFRRPSAGASASSRPTGS